LLNKAEVRSVQYLLEEYGTTSVQRGVQWFIFISLFD